MIQKMRNGKPFQARYKSSGQAGVEVGYEFSIFFMPDADGYIYFLSEGKDTKGDIKLYLLYPTPFINPSSKIINAKQEIEVPVGVYENPGTETVWMIWTREKNRALDEIISSIFNSDDGEVSAKNKQLLQPFIDKYDPEKNRSIIDSANDQTVLTARGDQIVHKFEIKVR